MTDVGFEWPEPRGKKITEFTIPLGCFGFSRDRTLSIFRMSWILQYCVEESLNIQTVVHFLFLLPDG